MKQKISAIWKDEFIKGGTILTVSSFLGSIISYLFNLFAARGLGPSGFGEISALFSYAVIFSVPMLVMSFVLIEKIGAHQNNSFQFALSLEHWFFTKLRRWWILILPVLAISPLVPRYTNLTPTSGYFLIVFMIFAFVNDFYGAFLQGLRLFFWISVIGIASLLLKLTGAILVLAGVDGLATIYFFVFASSILTLVYSHFLIKRRANQQAPVEIKKIDKRIIHAVLSRQVFITFLSILAINLFNNLDVVFVKKYFTSNQAGLYSSWSLLAKIIVYLTGPAMTVSYIFFSSKMKKYNHEKILHISLILMVFIGICSYFFYKLFPYFLINIFFGSKFYSVAPYLANASLFGTFYAIIVFINNYFLANKSSLALTLIGLLPIYMGLFLFTPKTIGSITTLNVYFSFIVAIIYVVAYGGLFFYNRSNGKKER